MADILGFDPKTVGETIAAVVLALGATWTARRSGEKLAGRADASSPGVIAASVISDGAIKGLGTTIRETGEQRHDDFRRLREDIGDLGDIMRDLTRAVREGLPPAAGIDLAALIARMDKIERKDR